MSKYGGGKVQVGYLYIKAAILFIALAVLVGVVMFAYNKVAKPILISEIPLVSSDKCITQMPPENPGGMIISNQNKMVYDPIKSERKTKTLPDKVNKNKNYNEEDKLKLLQEVGIDKLGTFEKRGNRKNDDEKERRRFPSVFDFADKEGIVRKNK